MKTVGFLFLVMFFTKTAVAEHSYPSHFVFPLTETRVSSSFGLRYHPVYQVRKHHTGIDLAAGKGTLVHSILAGKIIFADSHGNYGNLVVVQHKRGLTTHYAHLDSIAVDLGQAIWAGQVIGAVGSTGASTGPHLHFEVRVDGIPFDPLQVLDSLNAKAKG